MRVGSGGLAVDTCSTTGGASGGGASASAGGGTSHAASGASTTPAGGSIGSSTGGDTSTGAPPETGMAAPLRLAGRPAELTRDRDRWHVRRHMLDCGRSLRRVGGRPRVGSGVRRRRRDARSTRSRPRVRRRTPRPFDIGTTSAIPRASASVASGSRTDTILTKPGWWPLPPCAAPRTPPVRTSAALDRPPELTSKASRSMVARLRLVPRPGRDRRPSSSSTRRAPRASQRGRRVCLATRSCGVPLRGLGSGFTAHGRRFARVGLTRARQASIIGWSGPPSPTLPLDLLTNGAVVPTGPQLALSRPVTGD
jgi:hypothetical protein